MQQHLLSIFDDPVRSARPDRPAPTLPPAVLTPAATAAEPGYTLFDCSRCGGTGIYHFLSTKSKKAMCGLCVGMGKKGRDSLNRFLPNYVVADILKELGISHAFEG